MRFVMLPKQSDLFLCENNMLFLRVKISCFERKLTWYFIDVYIIKINALRYLTLLYRTTEKQPEKKSAKQVNNKWLFYYKKVSAQTPCFQTLNLSEIPK